MLRDTTNPRAHATAVPIFTEESHRALLQTSSDIRFCLLGLFHANVGPEWSSAGREETDYVHHIAFVVKGEAEVVHRGFPLELRPGFAYWLHGNTPVERRCHKHLEHYFLKFHCEWFQGIDALLDWPDRRPFCLGRWNVAESSAGWMNQKPTLSALLAIQGQLRIWVAKHFPTLDETISTRHQAAVRFGRVLRALEDQCDAGIRVRDLAKMDGSSPEAFSIAFSRALGMSPKNYLNRKLNQNACRLIKDTDLSVKAIASELHFSDEYYFTRFFTKMNGVPPCVFRKRLAW